MAKETLKRVYGGCCVCGAIAEYPIIGAHIIGFPDGTEGPPPTREELRAMLAAGAIVLAISFLACPGCEQSAMESAAKGLVENLRKQNRDVSIQTINYLEDPPN